MLLIEVMLYFSSAVDICLNISQFYQVNAW